MGFKGKGEVNCLVERSAIFVVRERLHEYIIIVFFSDALVII